MSYPQQNWQGYPEQGFDAPRKGSPTLAVISAIVGLGVAAALAWETLDLLNLLGDLTSQMPAGWTAMIIGHFVIAGIALIGAVLVFARFIAGAFILMTSAVLTIGAIVAAPVFAESVALSMVSSVAGYATLGPKELYYHELFEFEFDNIQTTLRFAALALGVILLIIAALPPSLNWLRRPRADGYSPQQAGW